MDWIVRTDRPQVAGVNCTEIDYCSGDPCQNDATCISLQDDYTCNCTSGYEGINCENDIDECTVEDTPCKHEGTCENVVGTFICHCPMGYVGQQCETVYVPCSSSPCENGGTCTIFGDLEERCTCSLGYTGQFCNIDIDDCVNNVCQNGGVCLDGENSYTCECPSEYAGFYCEEDVDECRNPLNCRNGAHGITPSEALHVSVPWASRECTVKTTSTIARSPRARMEELAPTPLLHSFARAPHLTKVQA
ncbi:notch [Apostichopus japonicus]|uniref:Notch n=1 Tax=Stichopus japonicus TaxID=307972 RepID=A0A2G8LJG7_STIJA|nr:notch [Apostichopus japonicus]